MTERQIAFFVDATKCTNCKTCEIACKEITAAGTGVRIRKVRTFELGSFPNVLAVNISMSCNHCEDPVCAKSCPANAYHKREDGTVIHDRSKCIGCRYCTWVCPYGAPQYDEAGGRIRKCDLCAALRDSGGSPACVEACPTRAITVGWLDELVAAEKGTMDIKNVPSYEITRPATRYKIKTEARNG
ncbi:MAG TPA: 4Fe-4S dicluster domain-containing protein [Terriglobales bacterium]